MRTLLNIIWHFPFFGFLLALWYAIWGVLFCCTIILLPVGLGYLHFARFLLSPFSSAMVSKSDLAKLTGKRSNAAVSAYSTVIRIVYFPFGLLNAIGAIFLIAVQFVSLIGIPCGLVWAKGLATIFNPVNKIRVPKVVADEIRRLKEQGQLDKYTGGASSQVSAELAGYTEEEESMENLFDAGKIKSGLSKAPRWQLAVPVALLVLPFLLTLLGAILPTGRFSVMLVYNIAPVFNLLNMLLGLGAGIYLLVKHKQNKTLKITAMLFILLFVIFMLSFMLSDFIGMLLGLAAVALIIGEFYGTPTEQPVLQMAEENE